MNPCTMYYASLWYDHFKNALTSPAPPSLTLTASPVEAVPRSSSFTSSHNTPMRLTTRSFLDYEQRREEAQKGLWVCVGVGGCMCVYMCVCVCVCVYMCVCECVCVHGFSTVALPFLQVATLRSVCYRWPCHSWYNVRANPYHFEHGVGWLNCTDKIQPRLLRELAV